MPADHDPANGWRRLLAAPVTLTLIGSCIIIGIASELGERREVLTWLTLADLRNPDRSLAAGLDAIRQGEIWRLVTPIFLHFSLLHIVFNMLWLKDLGSVIEARWSSANLIALVLVSAVLSNLAQFAVDWDLRSGVRFANALSGGMSGVVYCLLGYLWMRSRTDLTMRRYLSDLTVMLMLIWLLLCCTGALGNIANTAHAVGLLVGVVWGRIASLRAGRAG